MIECSFSLRLALLSRTSGSFSNCSPVPGSLAEFDVRASIRARRRESIPCTGSVHAIVARAHHNKSKRSTLPIELTPNIVRNRVTNDEDFV